MSLKMLYHTVRLYHYTVTPKKAWNVAKVIGSFLLSRQLKRPIHWGYPFVLMVEPTNFCNLRCPLCPSGNGTMTRARGNMKFENFRQVVDQIGEYLFLILFWNQGEPFINKHLLEMVSYAHRAKIATLISTNGHFIRKPEDARRIIDSGLGELIVSLDGATRESYNLYRVGGDFDTVLEAIQILVAEKQAMKRETPTLHLQFIVFKHNEHEMSRIREMAKALGADKFSYKTAQVYTLEEAQQYLPTNNLYSRYEPRRDDLRMKAHFENGCRHIWYSAVINWEGSVTPCCFDKDALFRLGNAFDGKAFQEIWHGQRYGHFRRAVLQDRASIDMCRNCSEGLRGGLFYSIEDLQ